MSMNQTVVLAGRLAAVRWLFVCVSLLVGVVGVFGSVMADDNEQLVWDEQWPHWRGPRADGVAPRANPPERWSPQSNIRWKTRIAGEGSATPLVWGNQIFVLSAVPTDRQAAEPAKVDPLAKTEPPGKYFEFTVWCLDRATGKVQWKQVVAVAVPHEGKHNTNTYASGSPSTDGKRLYVSFGSRGVFCLDFSGKVLWSRQLAPLRTRFGWGEGASPNVGGDTLIVNGDQEEDSYLVALNAATGETRWKVSRDEPTSWATPLIVHHGDKQQVIVSGTKRIRSYDLQTGEVLWQCGGMTVNAIPSPLAADGVVYCMSGYRGASAVAIPLDATGDITDSDRIRWTHRMATPYVPSPVLYGGQLYFTRENTAILSSIEATTGKPIFGPDRLPEISAIYASPLAAAGRIYIVGRDGTTVVLRAGRKLEVLATNPLGEPVDASPVAVGTQLFLRGAEHLYCIENAAK